MIIWFCDHIYAGFLPYTYLEIWIDTSSVRHLITVHGMLQTSRSEFYSIKLRYKFCDKKDKVLHVKNVSGRASKRKRKPILDSSMTRMFKYRQLGVNSIRKRKQIPVKRTQACWGLKNPQANYRNPSLFCEWEPGQGLCDDLIYHLHCSNTLFHLICH